MVRFVRERAGRHRDRERRTSVELAKNEQPSRLRALVGVRVKRDAPTRLYLFPDCPETLEAFRQLRAGHRSALRY